MNQVRKFDFILHCLLVFALLMFVSIHPPSALIWILIVQFFIGFYQVFSSFLRTVQYHSFDRTIQRYLIIYWVLCGLYGLGWGLIIILKPDSIVYGTYLLSAWGIAFYYCYITYRMAFPHYIKSHLDL